MVDFEIPQMEVDGVALVRTKQSLSRIKELQEQSQRPKENLVLTSFFIHPKQKEIIDLVAEETGRGKGETFRAIIDDWVAMQESCSSGRK